MVNNIEIEVSDRLSDALNRTLAGSGEEADNQSERVIDIEVFGQMEETSVPDPEGMNDRRSLAALLAVISFAADQGEMPHPEADVNQRAWLLEQNVVDLIGDLMHLDDRMPFNFDAAIETARDHYIAESEGE